MSQKRWTITFAPAGGDQYQVAIKRSGAVHRFTTKLPPDISDLWADQGKTESGTQRSFRSADVASMTPEQRFFQAADLPTLKEIGSRVLDAVFDMENSKEGPKIIGALEDRIADNDGVEIEFDLSQTAELSAIPWESLYLSSHDRFLAIGTTSNLVRKLDAQSELPEPIERPIRILVAAANPREDLNTDVELGNIERRITELVSEGSDSFEIQSLPEATRDDFRRKVLDWKPHVIHYIGHSAFADGKGYLYFESEKEGESDKVSAETLRNMLLNQRPWLVVLNSCQSGQTSSDAPMAGVAQNLLQRLNIPFVVAMQQPVSDDAAINFSQDFYTSLTRGESIANAVSNGRCAIHNDAHPLTQLELITPALYTSGEADRIAFIEAKAAAPAVAEEDKPKSDEKKKSFLGIFDEKTAQIARIATSLTVIGGAAFGAISIINNNAGDEGDEVLASLESDSQADLGQLPATTGGSSGTGGEGNGLGGNGDGTGQGGSSGGFAPGPEQGTGTLIGDPTENGDVAAIATPAPARPAPPLVAQTPRSFQTQPPAPYARPAPGTPVRFRNRTYVATASGLRYGENVLSWEEYEAQVRADNPPPAYVGSSSSGTVEYQAYRPAFGSVEEVDPPEYSTDLPTPSTHVDGFAIPLSIGFDFAAPGAAPPVTELGGSDGGLPESNGAEIIFRDEEPLAPLSYGLTLNPATVCDGMLTRIYFDLGATDPTEEQMEHLENAAYGLRCPNTILVAAGFADRTGDEDLNNEIGFARSMNVVNSLNSSEDNYTAVSWALTYGEEFNDVPTEDGVAEPENRRVEVYVDWICSSTNEYEVVIVDGEGEVPATMPKPYLGEVDDRGFPPIQVVLMLADIENDLEEGMTIVEQAAARIANDWDVPSAAVFPMVVGNRCLPEGETSRLVVEYAQPGEY